MTHLSPYYRYLAIPPDYGPTRQLRWSAGGDAIETTDGKTFFVRAGLPSFLEGFAARRPLIHFVYILELLHLLGHRDDPPSGWPPSLCRRVCETFRAEGMPLRNAGSLFGIICRDMPAAALSSLGDLYLAKWLAKTPVFEANVCENTESLPLDPDTFRKLLINGLEPYSDEELRHWFQHGCGIIHEAKRLAAEILDLKPPSIAESLDSLLRQRPRLAGSLPLVNSMIGALSLPPRKRTHSQLPLGGYVDATNRGDPERLLPSQFALDGDEFVRRFAEKELLFFQREEPPHRMRETVVLLVDQGVRTWGSVRLALSAAVLAFRQLVERKRQSWKIRFSGSVNDLLDPAVCKPKQLVDQLEASDLSLSPADLVRAEAEAEQADADVVLLTHPLALQDPAVRSAACLLPARNRLFALVVDEEGAAQFSEMRSGEPIALSRFRIQFQDVPEETEPLVSDDTLWRGDIEPVPYPFPIGPFRNLVALDFDVDCTHLLAATQKGYLHLWRLSDRKLEMLPRAFQNNQVLSTPEAVLPLYGGFVVGGLMGGKLVVAHYDLRSRRVKVHTFGIPDCDARDWRSYPIAGSVGVQRLARFEIIEAQTGKVRSQLMTVSNTYQPDQGGLPRWVPVYEKGQVPSTASRPFVEFWDGTIDLHDDDGKRWARIAEDGRAISLHNKTCKAQYVNGVLALAVNGTDSDQAVWRCYDMNESLFLNRFETKTSHRDLCRLSPDGRLFAAVASHAKISVRALGESNANCLTTEPGRVHTNMSATLFTDGLYLEIGGLKLEIAWRTGPLVYRFAHRRIEHTFEGDGLKSKPVTCHVLSGEDTTRFVSIITIVNGSVDMLIDVAGQIVIYDTRRQQLVCVLLPRREQLAAWMPDGTLYGPSDLIGGPSTPDALERLGTALRRVSRSGGS